MSERKGPERVPREEAGPGSAGWPGRVKPRNSPVCVWGGAAVLQRPELLGRGSEEESGGAWGGGRGRRWEPPGSGGVWMFQL